jgi:L-amino acid N-acyltransferase YncA
MAVVTVVRGVRADDLDDVREILSNWLLDADTGLALADEIDERVELVREALTRETPRRYLVAESEGAVVGIIGLQSNNIDPELFSPSERPVELITAYVRRNQCRVGIGRALADEAEALATAIGFTTLLVVSGSRNRESGYPFWRRRYGNHVRYDAEYFGAGQERVVWRVRLAPEEKAAKHDGGR